MLQGLLWKIGYYFCLKYMNLPCVVPFWQSYNNIKRVAFIKACPFIILCQSRNNTCTFKVILSAVIVSLVQEIPSYNNDNISNGRQNLHSVVVKKKLSTFSKS